QSGHHDPNGGPLLQGRADGKDVGLGINRNRRLHAYLRRLQAGGVAGRRRPQFIRIRQHRQGTEKTMADIAAPRATAISGDRRTGLHKLMQRKSTIAFLMALPLILLIGILVAYPAGYAVYLSMLNKSMTKFVAFGNFDFLFKRATFWDI